MKRSFPFPAYPAGWFQVAYSDELAPGAVLPLQYFGQELVLFRTEDGQAKVLDAFCPHLGAHLGHGGTVAGSSIRCPFHAWCFDGAGQCTEVPYAKKIPPKASIRAWHVDEVNGMIYAWYHPFGEAPSWKVPPLPEHGSDEFTPWEKRRWKIRTRAQEMAENSVDSAHFFYVHRVQNMPTANTTTDGQKFHMVSKTVMKTPAGKVEGQIEVNSLGFGFTSTRFTGLVETLLVSSVTAIDEEYVDVRFSFSIRKLANASATAGVGAAFIKEISRQLEQDIVIWEHKTYIDRPVLCDGDGPIGLFRKWVRQFYPDYQPEKANDALAAVAD